MGRQIGWIDVFIAAVVLLMVALVLALIPVAILSKWERSEQNVSGIVYNTTNNSFISGNTNFAIRASVDTYIDKDTNESAYCLPPDSQYKELVNRAAADKNIKVQVTTKRGFWWKAPWTCINNVTVKEIK